MTTPLTLGIFQNNPMAFDAAVRGKFVLHKRTPFRARIGDVLDHAARQGREVTQQIGPSSRTRFGQMLDLATR